MIKELGSDLEPLDVELSELPQELRWREWMNRIEAIIFSSGKVVSRDILQKVIGKPPTWNYSSKTFKRISKASLMK